jgi:hypothetical protein
MEDNNEDITLQILEGLSVGQQQLAQLLTQLISINQKNQNHGSNNGVGGSNVNNENNGEGNHPEIPTPNHNRIHVQVGAKTNNKTIPRPLMPKLLGNQQTKNQGQQVLGETFQDYLREYRALGDDFHASMLLQDLCTIKYRNRPRDHNRGQQNKDLAWNLGKLSIWSFNGSSKSTTRAWAHKLDTYF